MRLQRQVIFLVLDRGDERAVLINSVSIVDAKVVIARVSRPSSFLPLLVHKLKILVDFEAFIIVILIRSELGGMAIES